jgi:hypothetical protein
LTASTMHADASKVDSGGNNAMAAQPAQRPARVFTSGGRMAWLLGVCSVLYILLAVGCAAYLLWKAYNLPFGVAQSDFDKLAVAALIAVVGTGLTGLASVYSATRQSATAYQVAEYNGVISTKLTEMKADTDKALAAMKTDIDGSLAEFKAASDESLARLKVALDAGQITYRELYGTATAYFHALRSAARFKWEDGSIWAAETAMISAARHIINVQADMRDQWFMFWQRAQDIYRAAIEEADEGKRPDMVGDLILEKVGRLNFRELHGQLEDTARLATEAEA